MSNDIRLRLTGVGAVGRVRPGGERHPAFAAMSALAGRVAEQIARELDLAGDGRNGDGRGANFVLPNDLYAVRRQADELARSLNADAAETVRLTRALDRFVEVCTALMAARPAAFTVEKLRAIVAEGAEGHAMLDTVASVCDAIDRACLTIEGLS